MDDTTLIEALKAAGHETQAQQLRDRQLAAHLREAGRPLPIYHPVELLDASIHGTRAADANRRRVLPGGPRTS